MSRGQQVRWAEDDFTLPRGAVRLTADSPSSEQTYVMYHGTSGENMESIERYGLRPSSDGMLGPGVYLSRNLLKASRYPLELPEDQRVVFRVLVNVGKVVVINRQGHPMQKTWHQSGYDTAWVPPGCGMVKSGLEENCVWDPQRIHIIDWILPEPVQGGACWSGW